VAILLALASAVLGGTANFIGGTLARRMPTVAVVAATQALGLMLTVVLLFAVDGWEFPWALVAHAVPAGMCMSIGLGAFYAAMATGAMTVAAPLASLGVVVPLTWALALGDLPSTVQLGGILLAVVGVVALAGTQGTTPVATKSLLLAGGAGLGFGGSLLLYTQGAQINVLMTLFMMKFVIVLPLLGLAIPSRSRGGWPSGVLLPGLGLASADVTANVALGVASRSGPLALVSVLASLYPITTVLLARVIHRERLGTVRAACVTAVLTGVALISAGAASQ
jgi:drug/metabolite transporter (DMT)-like permease